MIGLVGAGSLLYAGLYAPSPYVAVALLSLCFAFTQFAEGAFWSAQTFVAGPYTAPACGLMNTGGNAAGIVVAPLMPFLAQHIGWVAALATGTGAWQGLCCGCSFGWTNLHTGRTQGRRLKCTAPDHLQAHLVHSPLLAHSVLLP